MSQASTSSAAGVDGAIIELSACLLLRSKYTRIWRKISYIRFIITLKKQTTANRRSFEYPLSSLPYTSLPPTGTSSSKSFRAIDIEEEREEKQRIRNGIGRIVMEQDLKLLLDLGGVDRIYTVLHGQRQHSEVGSAIDNGNLGMLATSLLNTCKHNCYSMSLLLISAGLSFATEFKQEGPRYGWHDGVAIVFAVLLLLAFSSITNFWRERQMMKLAKRESKLEFTVERGPESQLVTLAISDIAVGDRVHLKLDNEVPADGLFLDGEISVMHGAIKTKSDRETKRFLITGSKVIEGNGRMLVASVANQTNLAKMQNSMSFNPEKRGLLESLIEKPFSDIDKVVLLISTLVSFVVFIRLICKKDVDSNGMPEIKGKISVGLLMETLERMFSRPQGRISILTGLVTVVILCVQHGAPLMVAISLNYQIDEVVSEKKAVLNNLSACANMGLVTVICIDVSGGLMSEPKEVSRILMGETDISEGEGPEADLIGLEMLKQGVGLSDLAPHISFSPVSWAETWEIDIKSCTKKFEILKHSKLNSDSEGSGVLVREIEANEQVLHLHWSGAASTILEMCSYYYDSKGERHAMQNKKNKFVQVIKEMEDSGLKPIAFAHKRIQVEELEQDELILLGLIGFKYTCQESTKLALKNLENTKIQLRLVSEDDIMLVTNIACELGIGVSMDGNDMVLEGKELQDLNGEAILDRVDGAIVMVSFCHEDKLLMVQCLQKKDHVVAYVGRRLSDTAVLKQADVGIAHNSLSRIVDGESDISIKCLCALKLIVRAGRSKYLNIQKFIQLQLTCIISGSFITLITTIFTGESPLTAIQLIWVNMLICLLGSLMMVMKLNIKKQLDKKPSKRNQSSITKQIWKSMVIQVLYQALVCMILEFAGDVTDSEKRVRKAMIFNTFQLCQLFNLLLLLEKEVFKIVVHSYCFLVALGGCFLVQVLVIEYAKGLADCMKLNATQWAMCFLVGALSWVYGLVLEYLRRTFAA